MKWILMLLAIASAVAGAAQAEAVAVDRRAVTQDGVTTQLVRFEDRAAQCPMYGIFTVTDAAGRLRTEKTVCGAENILSAVQGDEVVVYLYARGPAGLALYRYIPARDDWAVHDFKASELRITSRGTEVMVEAYYPAAGGGAPKRVAWTWHPRFETPRPI